jgi:hypothetical protein
MTVRPRSAEELARVIDQAFHFRGDVTLHLGSGERFQGYVFNRDADATAAVLDCFVQGEKDPRRIPYRDVDAISFSGEDTASGKDYEAWREKKECERHAEAARIEAAARARGHL